MTEHLIFWLTLSAVIGGAALIVFASATQVLIENPSNRFNWINTMSMYGGLGLIAVGVVGWLAHVAGR